MKRLYIIRHAKSSWKQADLDDIDRPLNKRGKRDAPFMGERLRKQQVRPDLVVTSSARRALKTAKLISREVGYPKEKIVMKSKIYYGGVAEVISVIQMFDDTCETAFLIGHNPTFTELANALSNLSIDNIPTCGIISMKFDVTSWKDVTEGGGRFLSFDFPKKYP